MLFGSLFFLTVFLPVVLGGHWALQAAADRAARRRGVPPSAALPNAWLLLANAVFCAFGDPFALALLAGSALVNWWAARALASPAAAAVPRLRRAGLAAAVAANLILLGVFKYAGFFAASANAWLGLGLPVPELWLPLGVSFWTFRAISALVDAARGTRPPLRSPLTFATWLSFFPVLVSGPIARVSDMDRALASRPFSADRAASGFRRILVGLAKKALVADALAPVANAVWDLASAGSGVAPSMAALGLLAYSLQLYFDFSGYTDVAVGLGRALGFELPENFRWPYAADSVRDFWRRWHVSLSSWFRDYLYIPLGGSRRGLARTCANSFLVFLLCGLWHGAGAMFVLWGAWHGVCIVAERLVPAVPEPRRAAGRLVLAAFRHAWALFAVLAGWLLFRSPDAATAATLLRSLAGLAPVAPASRALWIDVTPNVLAALAAGTLFSFPVVPRLRAALRRLVPETAAWCAESLVATLLGAAAFLFLAGDSFRSFLYFKF